MSTVEEAMIVRHRAFIEAQDPQSLATLSTPERLMRRLQRSNVLLLIDGTFGLITAHLLSRLQLRMLAIQSLNAEHAAALQSLGSHMPEHVQLIPAVWQARNMAVHISQAHLLIVALERPYPTTLAYVNQTCQHVGLSWLPALQWGAESIVGPAIVPGITACYECYHRRLRSNEKRLDVAAAREQYFTNEQQRRLSGQFPPLLQQTAALVTIEAQRLLTAVTPPSSLNCELVYNVVTGSGGRHWVVPVELCPVCTPEQHIAESGLAAVVSRLARQLEEVHVEG